jgi:IS30 family transposase
MSKTGQTLDPPRKADHLVGRSARSLLASRLGVHGTGAVADRLVGMVSGLPAALRRTLTLNLNLPRFR